MSKKTRFTDHLIPILVLPFMVIIVIPYLLNKHYGSFKLSQIFNLDHGTMWLLALLIFIPGFILFVLSIRLFHKIGNGTLAPWKPTQNLVVKSLYAHMRNPMITGVILLLISESLIYNSAAVFYWMLFFFITCTLYFILSEEPGLVKRFGQEYIDYKANVPRWIPRLKAWKPE